MTSLGYIAMNTVQFFLTQEEVFDAVLYIFYYFV